jgi:anaerobic magnesium-protoporphyrin IX monomethyl ester cyclase
MIVGIKCYSHEVTRVRRMTEVIRKSHPEARITVGGPHPSVDSAGVLSAMPVVDYAFLGESERSFKEFALWVKQGSGTPLPESIPGIAYRGDSGVEVRDPVFEEDLDKLPMPAWDMLPPDEYPDEAAGIFVPGFPTAPMMLSRGCPFRCSYCGSRYVMGERIRYRTVASILEEINILERDYGVRTFTFVDDNFTCNRERAMELFEALAERPRRIAFTFPNGVRPGTLDAELLRMMERAGCYSLALGIESGSDATLSRMKKRQTTAEIRQAVDLIRGTTSMRVTGFFILGYPGETLEDVRKTIQFATDLPIHHPHFCVFVPIPGTQVYDELRKEGWIPPEGLEPEQLTFDRPSFSLPGLPPKRLILLHQYAYLRFYMNPWRIWNLLKEIRSLGNMWVIMRRTIKLFG